MESVHETLCYSPNVLADSYIVPQCRAEPRSLGALMALYEGNFIKLIALAPALKLPGARSPGAGAQQTASISRTAHDLDLPRASFQVIDYQNTIGPIVAAKWSSFA